MKKAITTFLFLFFTICTYSQLTYARKNVKKLSSNKMKGRGYVKNGDLKAAKYISNEFKKLKLLPYKDSYFQNFTTSVNTQPNKLKVVINDTLTLIPGRDYLIDPSSPSLKGDFETILINIKDILNIEILREKLQLATNKALLIDTYNIKEYNKSEKSHISEVINFLTHSPENPAAVTLFFSKNKLTWSGSTRQGENVSFTLNKVINLSSVKRIYINTESEFFKSYKTQNVIGYIKGTSKTDSTIVMSAHYDHLGMMGKKTIFPGANDNASGIALLLELAKHFSSAENKPKYNLIFIAFGAEEIGLLGSKYYVENPLSPLSQIKFMINFDLAGTGDEGIKVVNGTKLTQQFDRLVKLNKDHSLLPLVSPRDPACISDHCFFYEHKVPVFYIYTLGGIKAYHDIYDKSNTLPLTEFKNYSKLIKLFVNTL